MESKSSDAADAEARNHKDRKVSAGEGGLLSGDDASDLVGESSGTPSEDKMVEWRAELEEIEEDIRTLRGVLAQKERRCAELKRNLGIGGFKIVEGLKTVKDSAVYQTVEGSVEKVAKVVSDAPIYHRTSSIIGGIAENLTSTIGRMRRSESIRSMEEKVESVCENVLTKVMPSRRDSGRNLEESLTNNRPLNSSNVTSPTIPEDKSIA